MSYSIDDIITLTKAGFTAEQITALSGTVTKNQETEVKKPENNEQIDKLTQSINILIGKLTPAEEPENKQDSENKQNSDNKQNDAINDTLSKLNAAIEKMQNSNIVHTEQPKKESTDDILAQIINPPRKE